MLEEYLTPSVKHGGGNVMVWGCFGAGKVGDLYKVKGILNKEGNHSILQCHAIPCGQRLIGANFLLQQDNDPKHTSKLCMNWTCSYCGLLGLFSEDITTGEGVPSGSPLFGTLRPGWIYVFIQILIWWDVVEYAYNPSLLWEIPKNCTFGAVKNIWRTGPKYQTYTRHLIKCQCASMRLITAPSLFIDSNQ